MLPQSYLFSNQGTLVQARADLSLTASAATVAFWNICQPKSHSSAPPAAMAAQYTVDLRLGWILNGMFLITYLFHHKCSTNNELMLLYKIAVLTCLKIWFIPEFSAVFSVIWPFRNHWCWICSRNNTCYYQCWKQLCFFFFFFFRWM